MPEMGAGDGLTVTVAVIKQPEGTVYVITAVPVLMPETIPEEVPTVATEGLLLLQLPLAASSLNVVVPPAQTVRRPIIDKGVGFTVITFVALQPVNDEVNVITGAPVVNPVTIPEVDPTLAIAGLLLLQVPGTLASVNATGTPVHTGTTPEIGAGGLLTIKNPVAAQPAPVV